MTKLKTLEDMKERYGNAVPAQVLHQEAVKWIKEFRKRDTVSRETRMGGCCDEKYEEEFDKEAEIFEGDEDAVCSCMGCSEGVGCDTWEHMALILIKFFNIKEEELK